MELTSYKIYLIEETLRNSLNAIITKQMNDDELYSFDTTESVEKLKISVKGIISQLTIGIVSGILSGLILQYITDVRSIQEQEQINITKEESIEMLKSAIKVGINQDSCDLNIVIEVFNEQYKHIESK